MYIIITTQKNFVMFSGARFPYLSARKCQGNTFLMDFWLRLGTWQFYGRKCKMGTLFCLTTLRGGFRQTWILIMKLKWVFSVISFLILCTWLPSCIHIQLPNLLPSFLRMINDTPVAAVSLISLNSPFPFSPSFCPSSSLLPSCQHPLSPQRDQSDIEAAAQPWSFPPASWLGWVVGCGTGGWAGASWLLGAGRGREEGGYERGV